MNFKLYLEIFGSFNYVVPKDKEQQMYDFYTLSGLRGIENKRKITQFGGVAGNKPYYEPGNFEPGELESEEKQLDYMLEEIADKLLPYMKNEFTGLILKAVAGELGYVLRSNDPYILELMIKEKSSLDSKSFEKFIQDLVNYMEPTDFSDDPYHHRRVSQNKFSDEDIADISSRRDRRTPTDSRQTYPTKKAQNFGYQKNPSGNVVLLIAKKHFSNIDSFMSVAKFLFLNADWSEYYGGKSWANIVDSYFKLKSAASKNQLIMAIDHVYDLQHNTGTIFTKNPNYAKKTTVIDRNGNKSEKLDYNWIKNALDFKRDLRSIKELLNKVSPGMRTLASRIIKNKNI